MDDNETSWPPWYDGDYESDYSHVTHNNDFHETLDRVNVLVAGVMCVLGLVSNLAGLCALGQHHTIKDTTRFLLQRLAAADSLFLVSSAVLGVQTYLSSGATDQFHNSQFVLVWMPYMMLVFAPMWCISLMAATWLVVVFTAHRYVTARRPALEITTRLQAAVVGVWIGSVVFNVPRFFEYTIEHGVGLRVTALALSASFTIVYRTCLCFVAGFLLPVVLTTVFLLRTIQNTRVKTAHTQLQLDDSVDDVTMVDERHLAMTWVGVVVVFIACQSIAVVCDAYGLSFFFGEITGHLDFHSDLFHRKAYACAIALGNLILIFNSSIKLPIYLLGIPNFRNSFVRVLCCCFPSKSNKFTSPAGNYFSETFVVTSQESPLVE